MRLIIFLFFSSLIFASSFNDNFNTNTSTQYNIVNSWTAGGTGSFTYDGNNQRVHVLTGDNIALAFSHPLSSSTEGSFSIDFLPITFYPNGGVVSLKLIQDASTYYIIENTDNYGPKALAKYVNGVKVDSQNFSSEYTQGVNYTISINFSPTSTTVQAFGQTLTINNNSVPITVNSFSMENTQQDAFYDNIVYNPLFTGGNILPIANAGENQSIHINQTLLLTGSGSDSDGSIQSYVWKRGNTILSNTTSFTYIPTVIGTDTLSFTVTDNDGANTTDYMNVTVTAEPIQTEEIVIDNLDTEFSTTGTWTVSIATDVYAEDSFYSRTVGSTATWNPTLTETGNYKLYVWYSGSIYGNRDTSADYTVNYAEGSETIIVNQNQGSGMWVLLGSYLFNTGNSGNITLVSNTNSSRVSIADAVKFVLENNITQSNTPPTANAGIDKTIMVGNTLSIIGSGSDSDGTIISYEWKKGNTILATTASFEYIPNIEGLDTLTLTVKDDDNATAIDSVDIEVVSEAPVNTAPIADAGVDQSVDIGVIITLDASGSSDIDDDTLSYLWSLTTKPTGSNTLLSNTTAVSPHLTPDIEGTYILSLIVNDGVLSSTQDTVTIISTTPNTSNTFNDNFNTNTSTQYNIVNSWTAGGTGNFTYDGNNQRVHVLTGDNIALAFSHPLSSSTEGSFSIDFLPITFYPNGGVVSLKLIQDASTYYIIENTDNYGPKALAKYVNGVKVDSQNFSSEYTQGVNYTISINFSPTSTTVQAFGQTLTINNNSVPITVNSFSMETTQQDAFYDNIVYNIASNVSITTPLDNYIQSASTLLVKVSASNIPSGGGIMFILDENTPEELIITDKIVPYEANFNTLSKNEHTLDSYIINVSNIIQSGIKNHDRVINIARGDIYVAFGDSITNGYGDTISSDNISQDSRNNNRGYPPILNNDLSTLRGYPHSIINEGKQAETIQQALIRLPSVLTSHTEATTYLILIGTNNTSTFSSEPLESGKGLSIGDVNYTGTYKDYLQQIITLLNSAGKEIVLAKIPVVLGTFSSSGNYTLPITGNEIRNTKTKDFNTAIDELRDIPSNNITVVPPDFYNYFKDNYTNEYFDNLHPNGLGYKSMSDLWKETLTQ